MFQEMCADCGVALDGTPLKDDWDPNSPAVVEKMRNWLSRLRQTCLHPQVGLRNRKALGSSKGPLRTVAEVLAGAYLLAFYYPFLVSSKFHIITQALCASAISFILDLARERNH